MKSLVFLAVFFGLTAVTWANSIAPWYTCEGKEAGEICSSTGSHICEEQSNPNACPEEINPCLYCVAVEPEDTEGGCGVAVGASFSGLIGLLILSALTILFGRRESRFKI